MTDVTRIRIYTQTRRHFQRCDIVRLPDADHIRATVYIHTMISEAAHIAEICDKHKQQTRNNDRTARLAIRLRTGGALILPNWYDPRVMQTLSWEYPLTVKMRYCYAEMMLHEPTEIERWNGYGHQAVNPSRWFEMVTQARREGKPCASVDD